MRIAQIEEAVRSMTVAPTAASVRDPSHSSHQRRRQRSFSKEPTDAEVSGEEGSPKRRSEYCESDSGDGPFEQALDARRWQEEDDARDCVESDSEDIYS